MDEFVACLRAGPAVAYLSAVVGGVAVLLLLEPSLGHRFLLVNILICSLLGSITVLCSSATSKFLAQLTTGSSQAVLRSPVPYLVLPVLATTAVLQVRYLNKAMAHFHSTQVVPTYYILFTLASISGGGIVLQDFWRFERTSALGFSAGAALCFGGVGLITRRPQVRAPLGAHLPHSEATPADVAAAGACTTAAEEAAVADILPAAAPAEDTNAADANASATVDDAGEGGARRGDDAMARARLQRVVRHVARAHHIGGGARRLSALVVAQLDTALLGGREAAERAANREFEPPVSVVSGAGTLLSLHRASMRRCTSMGVVSACSAASRTDGSVGRCGDDLATGLLTDVSAAGAADPAGRSREST